MNDSPWMAKLGETPRTALNTVLNYRFSKSLVSEALYMDVTFRRSGIKVVLKYGIENWLEDGPFCLLFAAVGKKSVEPRDAV